MSATFLDQLTQAYIAALLLGFETLHPYAFLILGLLGTLALLGAMLPHLVSQDLGAILAGFLGMLAYMCVMLYLSRNLKPLAMAFFLFFTRMGAEVSGGAFTADDFQHPSTLLDMGFKVGRPVLDLIQRFSVIGGMLNVGTVALYLLAYVTILLAFVWAIKDVIMAILLFYFALMAAPVLIPWGLLSHTAFFMDFGLSWLISTVIRMFLTAAVLGIGVPLFRGITLTLSPGGDPTLYSAWCVAVAAAIFAVLVHQVASQSSAIGGKGMAMMIPGSALVPKGAVQAGMAAVSGGWSAVGGAAIRGASKLLQARKGGMA